MTCQHIPYTVMPPRLRAALRAEIERARRCTYLALQETQELPIVKPAQQTRPLLPLDNYGRPYLLSRNPYEHTLDLSVAAVRRFREMEGCYPTVILLSALRYLTYGQKMRYYYPPERGAAPIPYCYEEGASYELLCRGEVQ